MTHDNGTYSASTNAKTTGYVQYDTKLKNVSNIKFYISKTSGNTNSSSYFVAQYSTDKSTWNEIDKSTTFDKVTKNSWTKVSIDCSSSPITGYIRIAYTGTTAIRLLDDITITYSPSSSNKCNTPEISPSSKNFANGESVEVSMSCTTTDAKIYYTLDGSTPSDQSAEYTAAFTVKETTTVKAIAYADGLDASDVATATYTIIPFSGKGTFEIPYLVSDIKLMKTSNSYATNDVWVKGYIVGSCKSGSALNAEGSDVDTNIALADNETSTTDFIPVALPTNNKTVYLRNVAGLSTNSTVKGKLVYVYGTAKDYFSVAGVQNTSKIYGLNSVEIKTTEGYGTYYTNCAFEMPEGLTGSIITGVKDGKLVIESKYSAGDVVPANTGLLLKGENGKSCDLINTNSTASAPTNLLNGSVAETTTTGGDKYYMLSYESSEHKSLGFYWGEADGAAFTNGAHKAYLALTTAEAGNAKGFSFSDETTGISQVVTDEENNAAVYTIDGRRVENISTLKSGLYIVKGRKVVVK